MKALYLNNCVYIDLLCFFSLNAENNPLEIYIYIFFNRNILKSLNVEISFFSRGQRVMEWIG